MKRVLLLFKISFLIIFFFSCSNYDLKKSKLNILQGRYLFIEYYFKTQGVGEDYSVDARGNKTYWIIRNDSIFEEYFIRKNNDLIFDYDLVDQIKYLDKDNFKFYDTITSSFKLINDTLVIENEFFRYKLLKEN